MSSHSTSSPSSDSTHSVSSWSSPTYDSSQSLSSESSSWSSETSAWDTGSAQAKSYLVVGDITVKHNVFIARASIDLRWRDAVIVEARGPLLFDVGGTFGDEFYDEEIISWIDDLAVTKTWESYANAKAWMDTLEARAQASMAVLRQLYAQFPNTFDQRTRTV